jgi:hypothetical protein
VVTTSWTKLITSYTHDHLTPQALEINKIEKLAPLNLFFVPSRDLLACSVIASDQLPMTSSFRGFHPTKLTS